MTVYYKLEERGSGIKRARQTEVSQIFQNSIKDANIVNDSNQFNGYVHGRYDIVGLLSYSFHE